MSRTATALLLSAFALAACAGILGIRKSPGRPFEHRAHVVKGIACVKCHARVARSDANTALDLPSDASCRTCHAQPHDMRACGTCHGRDEDRHGAAQAKQHLTFSHAQHTAVASGNCTRCHDGVLLGDGPLRPAMATCLGCHQHSEQWAARSCTPCHKNLEGEHARPQSHVVHGDDFMQHHGAAAAAARDLCASCHSESTCAACHGVAVPALPSTWHFDEPRRPDMHAAGFVARHSLEARIDPALCTTCHRDQSGCQDCHRARGLLSVTASRGNPHPPDWVSSDGTGSRHGVEARRNPVSCASCHGGAGESLCVGCHRVGGPGGNPHPPGFQSTKRESELPCRLCHAGVP